MAQLSDTMAVLEIQALRFIESEHKSSTSKTFDQINKLSSHSSISFRSNGPSLLSTPLLRGMSGRHTAIVWSGWNILSPVNGVFDLSLINFNAHKVRLTLDPASDILGNGSAAGALVLEEEGGTYIQTSINTIDNHRLSAAYAGSNGNWNSSIKLSQQWNKNNYHYRQNQDISTRENNDHQQIDLQLSTDYAIDSSSFIRFDLWSQTANREIASSTVASYRGDFQLDDNYRLSASYYNHSKLGQLHLRGAYFIEQTIFDNDLIDKSLARNQASKAQVLLTNQLGDSWTYSTSYLFNHDRVKASFFQDQFRERTIHAFNHNGTVLYKKWKWLYGIRTDLINNEDLLESYHLKTYYTINRSQIYGGVSRGYQLANFNDLYWPNGGNENLKTERNWTFRAGISSPIHRKTAGVFNAEAFRIYANNWIIWSPNDQNIWSPDNRRSVISQGITGNIRFPLVKFSSSHELLLYSEYSYTDTSIEEDENQSLLGKQLIYIPKHKWSSTLDYSFHQLNLLITASYTSNRYIDNSNIQSLEAFMLFDLGLDYSFDLGKNQTVSTSISINNLFNQNYQFIRYFPQPLRFTEFSCKWSFQ